MQLVHLLYYILKVVLDFYFPRVMFGCKGNLK